MYDGGGAGRDLTLERPGEEIVTKVQRPRSPPFRLPPFHPPAFKPARRLNCPTTHHHSPLPLYRPPTHYHSPLHL